MDQKMIMELLKEAVSADGRRFNQIQATLGREIYQDEGVNNRHEALFHRLMVETYRNNKEGFPALFPVIALLCGDRDVLIFSSIDWDVYKAVASEVQS